MDQLLRLLTQALDLALSRACCKAGRSMAASMAMMAMTTRSSIKVKDAGEGREPFLKKYNGRREIFRTSDANDPLKVNFLTFCFIFYLSLYFNKHLIVLKQTLWEDRNPFPPSLQQVLHPPAAIQLYCICRRDAAPAYPPGSQDRNPRWSAGG